MKISTSYPYPVLSSHNDDYIESSFKTNIEVQEQFGEFVIDAEFYLNNEEMRELITSEDCSYSIHVECSQTSFRKMFKTKANTIQIKIPVEQLRGKVDIHSFVIAQKRIEHYQNNALNDWYKHVPLSFEKGNLLAIGDAIETTLFEDNMELLNLPSIVRINEVKKNDFMEVDYTSDLITISLPSYEYKQYALNANTVFKHTIISTVIVPALVYVFSKINEHPDDLAEFTWYQVMEQIFVENSIRMEDVGTDLLPAIKATQMILRKPLKASFEEFEQFNKVED